MRLATFVKVDIIRVINMSSVRVTVDFRTSGDSRKLMLALARHELRAWGWSSEIIEDDNQSPHMINGDELLIWLNELDSKASCLDTYSRKCMTGAFMNKVCEMISGGDNHG